MVDTGGSSGVIGEGWERCESIARQAGGSGVAQGRRSYKSATRFKMDRRLSQTRSRGGAWECFPWWMGGIRMGRGMTLTRRGPVGQWIAGLGGRFSCYENQGERRGDDGGATRVAGRALSGGVGGALWVPRVSDMSRTGMQSGAFPEGFREGHGLAAEAVAGGAAREAGAGEVGGGWRGGRGGVADGLLLPGEFAAGAGAAFAGGVRGGEKGR